MNWIETRQYFASLSVLWNKRKKCPIFAIEGWTSGQKLLNIRFFQPIFWLSFVIDTLVFNSKQRNTIRFKADSIGYPAIPFNQRSDNIQARHSHFSEHGCNRAKKILTLGGETAMQFDWKLHWLCISISFMDKKKTRSRF